MEKTEKSAEKTVAKTQSKGVRFLITLLKLCVTGLVIFYVVNKLGWNNIIEKCQQINVTFAVYGLIACFVSIILGAIQWHLLLHRKDLKITFRETFELYFIGMFFNNIGTVAGDSIKIAYIKRRHRFGKIGFAATFLDRFAGLLALLMFAGAGCIILLVKGGVHDPTVLLLVRFVAALILLFTGVLAVLTMRRLRRALLSLINRLPIPKKQFFNDLVNVTGLDINHFSLVASIGCLSILIQGLRISTHIFSAAAFGILTPDNLVYFFIFVPLVALVMVVPLPFGIRETFGGHLFALTGIEQQAAFLMQFMATLTGIVGSLWGGVEFLINMPRGVHQKDTVKLPVS